MSPAAPALFGCVPDTMFPRPMANKERSPSLGVLVKDSTTWLSLGTKKDNPFKQLGRKSMDFY